MARKLGLLSIPLLLERDEALEAVGLSE